MTWLTKEEKERLKDRFRHRWPEAHEALLNPTTRSYYLASNLWLGFKEGYKVGREEAEGQCHP